MAMTPMRSLSPFSPSRRGDALRVRADADGYLYLPGLLPQDLILGLRRDVLACCAAEGVVASAEDDRPLPGAGLREGGSEAWQRLYGRIQRLRSFHAANRHPILLGLLRDLLGGDILAHPRAIARVVWPDTARYSTPAHQDHFYIGGTLDTWTAWIPLGDCPAVLGGLAILPGSHRHGLLPVHQAEGAGGHGVDVDGADWVGGDVAVGDVLLMHSLTVHQGRDNTTGRLRLSTDFRYQRSDAAIDAASLQPHMGWWTWDELTADWPVGDDLAADLRGCYGAVPSEPPLIIDALSRAKAAS